eukprot:maker-scaffold1224_size54636-snap-gene-0.16 protein:Tk04425 transcript:maker-scaffold1224_size54636-snap-gene-0.16-mRNA-1 annotation:"protein o-linked-mannose beta- -n-acetylglucosaminyltransferase 2-like"
MPFTTWPPFWAGLLFLLIACPAGRGSPRPESATSSVWCHGSHPDHRRCTFRHLCYSPHFRQFVFFHSPASTFSGLDDPNEQKHLVKLTPVIGGEYFDYVLMPQVAWANFTVTTVDRPTLLFSAGHPHKLNHVIHDDLLPLYATLRQLCWGDVSRCRDEYQLALVGGQVASSRYLALYQQLTAQPLWLLDQPSPLGRPKDLTCFAQAVIGLDTDTLWYDHGFEGHQHSLDPAGPNPRVLQAFQDLYLNQAVHLPSSGVHVLVLKSNLIANLEDVKLSFKEILAQSKLYASRTIHIREFAVNQTDSLSELLAALAQCDILLGLHGPDMSWAVFAPQSALILEIFPYALHPDSFSFTRTLAKLKGNPYNAFINLHKGLSQTFPHSPPHLGGISHLPDDLQHSLDELEYVDSVGHNDPAYLYRLFQKTWIDHEDFREWLENTLDDQMRPTIQPDHTAQWMFPSKVFDIQCQLTKDGQIQFSWESPLNIRFVPHESIVFEILVEALHWDPSQGSLSSREYSTRENRITIQDDHVKAPLDARANPRGSSEMKAMKIWITPLLDLDLRGPEATFSCDLSDLDLGGRN